MPAIDMAALLKPACACQGTTYKGAFTITINWANANGSTEGSFVKK